MNGGDLEVSGLTGVADDPLDHEFMTWAELQEFGHDILKPIWRSEEDRQAFDDLGLELAHKLFERLHGTSTITYWTHSGKKFVLEARVKRTFPPPAQAGPEG